MAVGLWDRLHPEDKAKGVVDSGPTIAEAVETATDESTAPAKEVWGLPGRCPECNGRGYLDRIDIVDRIMYEHCTDCFHKWSVHESQTTPAS